MKMCINIVKKKFLFVRTKTKWGLRKIWDWLKKRYILHNFTSKWNKFDQMHIIQSDYCRNEINYISFIKNASVKINNAKIIIVKAVVIYRFNNLNHYIYLYVAILSNNILEKWKISIMSEFIENLKDGEIRFSTKMEEQQTSL